MPHINGDLSKARTEISEAFVMFRAGRTNTAYWCLWHAREHIEHAMKELKPVETPVGADAC